MISAFLLIKLNKKLVKEQIGKKTKIVATIGPASADKKVLEKMIKAGMNVARLNMGHGDHAEHQRLVENIRQASKNAGRRVAIIMDLSGPKIRIGDFYKKSIYLKKSQEFILTSKECLGDESRVFVNYSGLSKEVKPGSAILLDDGKKKLEVIAIKGREIVTKVITGGEIQGRRGVNVPGVRLSLGSLTAKDEEDVLFGASCDVDFFALSFVHEPGDILKLRQVLKKSGSNADIIAKIETDESVKTIDEIIKVADGIMIARGDLAVEISPEDIPHIQKTIIEKTKKNGKPVIVATQMLESMITNAEPTRAEVSDVANSIIDGTDAVMLSGETALGQYPVEVVRVIDRIARKLEGQIFSYARLNKEDSQTKDSLTIVDAVSSAVVSSARDISAKLLVALTASGFTARMISRHRSSAPLIVMSPNDKVCQKAVLYFGCLPVLVESFSDMNEALDDIQQTVSKYKLAKKGEAVVVAGGVPFGQKGGTNLMIAVRVK